MFLWNEVQKIAHRDNSIEDSRQSTSRWSSSSKDFFNSRYSEIIPIELRTEIS
jgi:hypothetical protein